MAWGPWKIMYLQGSVLLCVGAQLEASKIVSSSRLCRARFSKQSFGDIVLRVNILSKIIGILFSLDVNIVVFECGYSEQLNNLMVIPRASMVATKASIPMRTGQEIFISVRNVTAVEKNCFKTIILNTMISIFFYKSIVCINVSGLIYFSKCTLTDIRIIMQYWIFATTTRPAWDNGTRKKLSY